MGNSCSRRATESPESPILIEDSAAQEEAPTTDAQSGHENESYEAAVASTDSSLRLRECETDEKGESTAPTNAKTQICAICMGEHLETLLYQTQPCGHFFHFECLRCLYVDARQKREELKCPLDRGILQIDEMDFQAFHHVPQPPVWQWALSATCAGFSLEEIDADEWLSFPLPFQPIIEAAREEGNVRVDIGGAGYLDLQSLSFTPVATKAGHVAQPLPVRRCVALWKVSGVKRDDDQPGGYSLQPAYFYEPTVSQYIEQGYQQFLLDPAKATLTDPSHQYVYCFKTKPSPVNPNLIAMFQFPQHRPRAVRVITRDDDVNTETLPVNNAIDDSGQGSEESLN